MKQYVNEHKVAKSTGFAVQTLRNWRHQRRGFAYTKIGRSIRYDMEDVVKFMDARKIRIERI